MNCRRTARAGGQPGHPRHDVPRPGASRRSVSRRRSVASQPPQRASQPPQRASQPPQWPVPPVRPASGDERPPISSPTPRLETPAPRPRSRRRGCGVWGFAVVLVALGLAFVSVLQHLVVAPAPDPVANLSALSPQLGAYAQSQGTGLTVALYVPSTHQYYAYNEDVQTVMASTAKVPILLTLLDQAEARHRSLTSDETELATGMIEESDNDEAQSLYDEVTQDGVQQYLSSIGIHGIAMQYYLGYSTTTPLAMVELLEALRSGTILDAQDRAFALNLMSDIDPNQQMGIGQTAPQNATYYMKDGWVIAPDNTWTTASVGIVTIGQQTYDLAVYSQGNADEDDGWTVVNHVCGAVATLMAQR